MDDLRDTSPEQREKYFELLRRAGEQGRARILAKLVSGGRALVEAGLSLDRPDLTGEQRQRAVVERLYGHAAAERLYGPATHR